MRQPHWCDVEWIVDAIEEFRSKLLLRELLGVIYLDMSRKTEKICVFALKKS
jgi:hypothetical protein